MNAIALQSDDRAAWLAARRAGIGGSDVAAILGLSQYRTPLDVYLDKRGEVTDDAADNPAMLWGRILEPVIRQRYSDTTGREVALPAGIMASRERPFMLANPDGFTADRRIFEAKTARTAAGWGEPGTDEVPDAYALQVQHYMIVTGLAVADVAVLIGGSDFRIYTVHADPALQADLIAAEAEFWTRVEEGNPPPPVTFAEAQQRFGSLAAAGTVQASQDAIQAHAALAAIRAQQKELEAAEADAKAVLALALGDAGDTLVGPDGRTLATWKLAKAPERFDAAAFRTDHPDLAAAYTRPGTPSRRMLLKD